MAAEQAPPLSDQMARRPVSVRVVVPTDAGDLDNAARLLDDFNREFDTPTPGPPVLRRRLASMLAGDAMFAVLAGDPPVGIALVSLRPNVWDDGPVALLDELYVAPSDRNLGIGGALIERVQRECVRRGARFIEVNVDAPDADAQRFYRRHGFSDVDPDSGDRAYYFTWSAEPPDGE